jgi:peptide/nickel transport system ATP-binding protein
MLLSIEDLSVRLPKSADRDYAVRNLTLSLKSDEIVCVVGESGSGKSILAQAVMGILPQGPMIESGAINFEGVNLLAIEEGKRRAIRGNRVAMIFQEPLSALNPLMTIGNQITEVFHYHGQVQADIRQKAIDLIDAVGLPNPSLICDSYPFRLSGGQRQRVVIAMALALQPQLLIADEPTTALDVTTQAQILSLIRKLQRDRNMAVLFITHDFGVVADIADRVAVMRYGEVVETGSVTNVLKDPQHPYTKQLIAALPNIARKREVQSTNDVMLEVTNLTKKYFRGGGFFRQGLEFTAVKSVDLVIRRGETLGLVGESGSGKSSVGRCILRLIEPDEGRVVVAGREISALNLRNLRPHRHLMQMVFQDPYASLNPRHKIVDIIGSGLIAIGVAASSVREQVASLLLRVGLQAEAGERYPHEFSGGQRQRVAIARALALQPQLLIADEPVSALDVSMQAQILSLLRDLRETFGLSMLFITHDLRVAAEVCDRIAVMRAGEIVETGTTSQVFDSPQHQYTRALIAAIPGRSIFRAS